MAAPDYRKLIGTKGSGAVVGEATETRDGNVCWKLDPAYAAWFWPLMRPVVALTLFVPETLLGSLEDGDSVRAPRAPTEAEKKKLLAAPEAANDALVVYTLTLKGKPPFVHKAFPTRMVSVRTLRYCATRVIKPAAAVAVD